jgi:hypothetical protein
VTGKFFAEGVGSMAGNKAPDGGGDTESAKFQFVKMKLRFLDVDGNWAWTRSINILIELAFTPAPLLQLAWRMVVQMLPGRA